MSRKDCWCGAGKITSSQWLSPSQPDTPPKRRKGNRCLAHLQSLIRITNPDCKAQTELLLPPVWPEPAGSGPVWGRFRAGPYERLPAPAMMVRRRPRWVRRRQGLRLAARAAHAAQRIRDVPRAQPPVVVHGQSWRHHLPLCGSEGLIAVNHKTKQRPGILPATYWPVFVCLYRLAQTLSNPRDTNDNRSTGFFNRRTGA